TRSGHSPGWHYQKPADLRNHFAANGGRSSTVACAWKAFRPQRFALEPARSGLRAERRGTRGGLPQGHLSRGPAKRCPSARPGSHRTSSDSPRSRGRRGRSCIARGLSFPKARVLTQPGEFAAVSSQSGAAHYDFLKRGCAMKKAIVFLAGDGIGPEVTRAAVTVLREAAHEFHHQFEFAEFPIGGAAIDAAGTPLPHATLDACRKADAVFLGAVGGPKWDSLPVGKRPES